MHIKQFCKHEIYHCYYAISSYHSHELTCVNTYELDRVVGHKQARSRFSLS
jgi:hypothetical protein